MSDGQVSDQTELPNWIVPSLNSGILNSVRRADILVEFLSCPVTPFIRHLPASLHSTDTPPLHCAWYIRDDWQNFGNWKSNQKELNKNTCFVIFFCKILTLTTFDSLNASWLILCKLPSWRWYFTLLLKDLSIAWYRYSSIRYRCLNLELGGCPSNSGSASMHPFPFPLRVTMKMAFLLARRLLQSRTLLILRKQSRPLILCLLPPLCRWSRVRQSR